MLKQRDPFAIAADLIDPPTWEVRSRPPLQPHQVPPRGEWEVWLLLGGRGAGKTEACARYYAEYMRNHPGHRGRIIAPTLGDAVESCVRGPSGLLANDPDVRFLPSAPGGMQVRWPNKSEALLVGTNTPQDVDRLRAGGNRHLDWWEEVAACRHLAEAWEQAQLGLRLGDHPHAVGSTTPKVRKKLKEIIKEPGTVVTHGTMRDNPGLTDDWKRKLDRIIKGSRNRLQEIEGILLEEIIGALWKLQWIEEARVSELPEFEQVVVGVDPQAEEGAEDAETGIVVSARGVDGLGYCLDDRSGDLSPARWGRRACIALLDFDADYIVGEINNGGDMVHEVVKNAWSKLQDEGRVHKRRPVPFKKVRASKGKKVRAQPVAGLTEEHHIYFYRPLDILVEQLTTWVPSEGDSPDRLDAFVWGMSFLFGLTRTGRGGLRA